MPRGDGTGPLGQGPMTGGAFGYCAGFGVPGFANPARGGLGRGMAWGRGGGIGRGLAHRRGRGGFPAYAGFPAPAAGVVESFDEKTALESQVAGLEQALAAVRQRLSELEETTK